MKNKNGFGSVVKLRGNRRNPYVVRKTVGYDDRKYPIYNIIGYYPTWEAGMIALAAYNNDPYDVDSHRITVNELYELWEEKKLPKLGKSNQRSMKSAFNHCSPLLNLKYKEVRSFHMQDIIDNCGKGYSTQGAIKNLFGHLDNFAFEMDIINKRYSELIHAEPIPETSKKPFKDDEVKRIWKLRDEPWVDSVLLFLYSGWRISELLGLKRSDVDIEAGTMTGGVKTKSGKGRVVPIHSKVFDMVKRRYDEGHEYLFAHNGSKTSTSQYYTFWNAIMEKANINHTVHEARHTFRSRLDSVGANSVAINKIMGHAGKDTGERVYTHKSIDELKTAIEMITI